jgi:hypothetical protein
MKIIMQFSPTSCPFIPLGPYTLVSTLFSNTRSLRPSLNVRDQAWHQYRTQAKLQICKF